MSTTESTVIHPHGSPEQTNLGTPNGNGPYESAVVPAITRSDASDDEVTEAETEGSVASPKFVASPEGGLSPLNSLVHHPDSTPGSQDGGTEEGSEDDDEDDEDEEPALKYERLGGIASEILEKDTASCVGVSQKLIAIGTHNGIVHVLDLFGNRVKSYRAHTASINDIRLDTHNEFIATASMDGQAVIHAIAGTETYAFDLKRPLRAISMEPQFAKRGTRAFVCGGMAGTLVMHEKGWLGHKETLIHSNDGPIWAIQWHGNLIAWANDSGVKIYDTQSQERIMSIARPPNSPRADLFKCTLRWQDDTTLLIAWADHIMIARIRTRSARGGIAGSTSLVVEVTAHFQVDSMLSGLASHPNPLGSFLTLDYIPPDNLADEATDDPAEQRRKAANRPELRIISRSGEEISSDALTLKGYHLYGCNDYWLEPIVNEGTEPYYIVVSPKDIIIVKMRDAMDHINWLVEGERYEEALEAVEKLEKEDKSVHVSEIGRKYVEHLVEEGEFDKAAKLTPRVFGSNAKDWEDCIFIFAKKKQLQAITPFVPTKEPQLSRLVYEMVIAHFLQHDRQALLRTLQDWPNEIYDIPAVLVAVKSELDRGPVTPILMECIAELYMRNRQPGKALEYFLRLRKPNVFDLIRQHNLFVVVRDQVVLLVDFDKELQEKQKATLGSSAVDTAPPPSPKGKAKTIERSKAVALLVDHTTAIPIARVVQQLQARPFYLYLYLDALFDKDPFLCADFSDTQVQLYAEYEPARLIDFLRASNYYSLESAYKICLEKDLVPEMVFLLGRMGNNKKALNLIIERLGDVSRAIDFAKEQNDDDLWEDLLRYSETRPAFIRGLLENVGAEIDPIRLIRRIKNGLEIPGLKEALIKILWEFNLQVSLLEGCETVLNSDCTRLAVRLQSRQTNGYLSSASRVCPICSLPLFNTALLLSSSASTTPQPLVLLFLCRHLVHAACVRGGNRLPSRPMEDVVAGFLAGNNKTDARRVIGSKIAYAAVVRARLEEGCPVCKLGDGRLAHTS